MFLEKEISEGSGFVRQTPEGKLEYTVYKSVVGHPTAHFPDDANIVE